MSTLQEVGREAINSALYGMPFTTFLGERPDPESPANDVAWFRLNERVDLAPAAMTVEERAKTLMVEVCNSPYLPDVIEVRAHWLNYSGPEPLRGSQTFNIPAQTGESYVKAATEDVVLKLLDLFDQVRKGAGVAGPIDLLIPDTIDETDPDDDLAVGGPEFDG